MGKPTLNPDEWDESRGDEKRNSEEEYTRRAFEECHAKFGVEVTIEWRDGVSPTPIKFRRIKLEDHGRRMLILCVVSRYEISSSRCEWSEEWR
jgi:hypothetical protein